MYISYVFSPFYFEKFLLGIVEIYENINEGESGVRRSREKQRGPFLLRKYDYVRINANRQFVKKNIEEAHTNSKQSVNSSSSSSLEFSFQIITGLATIVQCGIFNQNSENLLL